MDISRLVIEIDSQGVLTANGNLEVFSRLGQKAGNTSDDMSKKFGAFMLIVNKLPGPLRSIASGLMGIVSPAQVAVSAFLELGGAVIQFGKDSLQAFGEFELIRSNLELTMGSAKEAKRVFSEVKDFAMKTPFDVAGTAQAVNMLKQAGVATKDLISTVEMLGNVSGGSMERFNRNSYNYVQVLQKGILDARDAREFAGNLVPINKALEDIGVTGKATADDMVRAFQYMTREGSMFYNAMYKQADTLIGKTSQLKEAWENLKATFADRTGLADITKFFVDALQSYLADIDGKINSKEKLETAFTAWNMGTATAEQALMVLKSRIQEASEEYDKLYDIMMGGKGGVEADRQFFAASEMLNGLRQQYDYYIKILEQEKERTEEIEKQKRLLTENAETYDKAMSSIMDRFGNTAEGKLQELRNERDELIASLEILKQGKIEEYQSDIPDYSVKPLDFSKINGFTGNPQEQRTFTRTRQIMPTEQELSAARAAIAAVDSEIEKLLDSSEELKDWQIELGKIFNFTPTAETRGLPTVTKYIDDLNASVGRLSASCGDKTIADILGISELDQAEARIAGIQSNLQRMLEFNGSEPWTVDNESIKKLIAELTQAQAEYSALYESDVYENYLSELNSEYKLLGKSNEEREKALFLDNMKKAGIKDSGYIDKLWNVQQDINSKRTKVETEERYKKNFDDLKEELTLRKELIGLSEEEARIKELAVQLGGEARAKEIYALEREIELNDILKSFDLPSNGAEKLMADILNISKLDQAKTKLSSIENTMRKMAAYKGTDAWKGLEPLFNRLKKDYAETKSAVGSMSEQDKYKKYLSDLSREYELLQMNNNEREKEVFFDTMKQAGITNQNYANNLWEYQRRNDRKEFTSSLKEQLSLEGMTTEEIRRQELARLGITGAQAEGLIREQKMLDILRGEDTIARDLAEKKRIAAKNAMEPDKSGGFSLQGWSKDWINDWKDVFRIEGEDFITGFLETVEDLQEALSPFHGGLKKYGEYAAASAEESAYGIIKGTDVGTFVKTTAETGSWEMGLIETFIQAFAKAVGGLEGIEQILNPITEMLGEFSPVLKSILLPLLLLEKGLVWAARGVMQAADFITGGLFSAMEDEYDLIVSANDGRREEEERIRALNEEYTKLSDALKEQQEYYMQQRRHLNAEHEIETYTVNDAIITPKGVVHTNPNDFIIATRTPETLGAGNGGDVYINIINNTSSEITTQQKTMGGGAKEITIMVDKIVQNGIATGKYDMAFGAQAARNRGKSIMA